MKGRSALVFTRAKFFFRTLQKLSTSTTLPRIGELRPQLLTRHWLEQARGIRKICYTTILCKPVGVCICNWMNLKQENAVSRAWIEWFHQGFESCVGTKEGLFNTCVYQVRIFFPLHTSKATSTTLPRIGELRLQLLTPHWLEQAAQCMKYEGY